MQEAAFRASDWEGYRWLGAAKRSALHRAHSIASCFERYGIHGGADSGESAAGLQVRSALVVKDTCSSSTVSGGGGGGGGFAARP